MPPCTRNRFFHIGPAHFSPSTGVASSPCYHPYHTIRLGSSSTLRYCRSISVSVLHVDSTVDIQKKYRYLYQIHFTPRNTQHAKHRTAGSRQRINSIQTAERKKRVTSPIHAAVRTVQCRRKVSMMMWMVRMAWMA